LKRVLLFDPTSREHVKIKILGASSNCKKKNISSLRGFFFDFLSFNLNLHLISDPDKV
jgi:hypothetical protein